MNEITITINGVEYIACPKETAAAETEKPKTGYERVEFGQQYYSDGSNRSYYEETEEEYDMDDCNYRTACYYSDETIAKNNARADELMRRLRQWQALNDKPVDWGNDKVKWDIGYDCDTGEIDIRCRYRFRNTNTIYFTTKAKTEEAIEVFKDDLLWYFTEYRQRLDEPEREAAE